MTNHKKVRKAVIAAAGFGARFLPQTKAMPKEMLPLVDEMSADLRKNLKDGNHLKYVSNTSKP
jgi:UTP-glucose-1-phosphate uridylyltransferase